jgi:hypothetical protein
MKFRFAICFFVALVVGTSSFAQDKNNAAAENFCDPPKDIPAEPGYREADIKEQPKNTADLPSVVRTVVQSLKCYQALSGEGDPTHPKGLPELNTVEMDFKTTAGTTTGLTFSIFVFKVGASRAVDVTDDLKFTYSVPKKLQFPKTLGFVRPSPATLYEELVKEVQAAARAALTQSEALGLPLNKVSISISYGIKFDGTLSLNAPVQLVTIGGNGDYNKNNTQTVTLSFENANE